MSTSRVGSSHRCKLLSSIVEASPIRPTKAPRLPIISWASRLPSREYCDFAARPAPTEFWPPIQGRKRSWEEDKKKIGLPKTNAWYLFVTQMIVHQLSLSPPSVSSSRKGQPALVPLSSSNVGLADATSNRPRPVGPPQQDSPVQPHSTQLPLLLSPSPPASVRLP